MSGFQPLVFCLQREEQFCMNRQNNFLTAFLCYAFNFLAVEVNFLPPNAETGYFEKEWALSGGHFETFHVHAS
jgi:hypothetical protein